MSAKPGIAFRNSAYVAPRTGSFRAREAAQAMICAPVRTSLMSPGDEPQGYVSVHSSDVHPFFAPSGSHSSGHSKGPARRRPPRMKGTTRYAGFSRKNQEIDSTTVVVVVVLPEDVWVRFSASVEVASHAYVPSGTRFDVRPSKARVAPGSASSPARFTVSMKPSAVRLNATVAFPAPVTRRSFRRKTGRPDVSAGISRTRDRTSGIVSLIHTTRTSSPIGAINVRRTRAAPRA